MKSFTVFTTIALAFAPFVAAHGFVDFMTVDGKKYTGPSPGRNSKAASAIRQVTTINPTYGAASAALNCGPGAQAASLSATANPGSSLAFHWVASPQMKWPHNTGAELTYMASCGSQDCSKFDSTKAKWFKINEYGLTNGKWAQATDAFVGKASPAKVPDNLAPGNYLVMHQLISLHIADHLKGAEFYSSCAQLKVTGHGTGAPSSNELVSIPGAYKDTDPGLLVNAFNAKLKYVFPGPPISKLAATSSAPTNNTGGNNTPSDPSTPSTPSNGNGNNNNGGSCKKSKRSHDKRSSEYKPRQVSRVMRDIAEGLTSDDEN
jgi:hypothetical protein